MQGKKSAGIFAILIVCIVVTTQFCSSPVTDAESPYLNHHDSVHYVGIETCTKCHLDKAQTFIHTGMGQSFDTVSRLKSSAQFESHHVLYDSVLNFYYHPFWRGNDLYLREFRLQNGDTVYKREESINYIIGSGQHTNSHLIRKGDYIVQAPFTWYAQDAKLDFPPGFENGNNSRFSRIIDQECMSCHNAQPVMKPGSTNAFASVGKGIDCERCHGPGSIHVAYRSEGNVPEGNIDYTIVNPSNLAWERQIDVCQRCHLQGNNILKPGKTFGDFKPGMVLSDYFEIYLPKYEGDQSLFNMANHSDRFQHSKCFVTTQKNGGNFTCISCHNPHVSVKTTDKKVFNNQCITCHSGAKTICKESKQIRAEKKDDCVSCHMPVSGTEDIPHVRVHEHKIGIWKEGYQEVKDQEVVGLYCVNNPDPEVVTQIEAYLTYYEKFDPLPIYQTRAEELLQNTDHVDLHIHLAYQKQNWSKIIELSNKWESSRFDGYSCYRIGKAFMQMDQANKAINWLELAVVKSPTNFKFKSELGAAYIKERKLDLAEETLLRCLKQFPEYAPALNNLAYVYLNQGQFAKAKAQLMTCLRLEPDNLKAKENMVLMYFSLHDENQEKYWLESILQQQPDHEAAKRRYSQWNDKE